MTKTISFTSLKQNLSSILNEVGTSKEVYFITRKKDLDVVMIAKDVYESLLTSSKIPSNKTKNPNNSSYNHLENTKSERYEN